LNLDDRMAQIRITEGTIDVRVRVSRMTILEIDTPNLAFSFFVPAITKLTSTNAGDTTVVVVRDGEGEVTGGGSGLYCHPREMALLPEPTNLTRHSALSL